MKKILLLLLLLSGAVQAQVVNFPDANLKNALLLNNLAAFNAGGDIVNMDPDNDGNIELPEILTITQLYLADLNISDITGVETFANLEFLSLDRNMVTSLTLVNGMSNLKHLFADQNPISNIDLQNLPALLEFRCMQSDELITVAASDLPNLEAFVVPFNNQLTTITVNNMPSLTGFSAHSNPVLTDLTMTNCPLVVILDADLSAPAIVNVNFSGCSSLNFINDFTSFATNLQSLNLENCSSVTQVMHFGNEPGTLNFLNISGCTALEQLQLSNTNLTSLDLTNKPDLDLVMAYNSANLSSLILDSSNSALLLLDISNTDISSVDFSMLPNLSSLSISGCPFTSLDVSGISLQDLSCSETPLTDLDLSGQTRLDYLYCSNTALSTLNIKNGRDELMLDLGGNLLLTHVCTDETQIAAVEDEVQPTTAVSSFCSFVPGGDYNVISGDVRVDWDGSGCVSSIPYASFIRVDLDNGNQVMSTFVHNGSYRFYTGTGDFTVTPHPENSAFYNFTPSSDSVSFATLDNTEIMDFCLTPNGYQPDLEVVLTPIRRAAPGFDVSYKVVYRNKGNATLSGSVQFAYNDAVSDFEFANPTPTSQSSGLLSWDFSGLRPMETRHTLLRLHLNGPTDAPPLQLGDVITSTAMITQSENEQILTDNTFVLNQTLINSVDPNNKICLEGETVTPEKIGQYLHYNINFENIGTADAIHVVVRDTINTEMFDINTLQIIEASHQVRTTVRGNVIEFVFENINLPPSITNPIGGHGNVLFKIKTLPTLQAGDMVTNLANIYFDYNHPIATNEARTTFTTLKRNEFPTDASVIVFPNPVKQSVSVTAKNNIRSIALFDVQGRVLQTSIVDAPTATLDISSQPTGLYFIRIITETGSAIEKLVKE